MNRSDPRSLSRKGAKMPHDERGSFLLGPREADARTAVANLGVLSLVRGPGSTMSGCLDNSSYRTGLGQNYPTPEERPP